MTWSILLSSAVVAALVSSVIAGIFNLRTKKSEYVNDYYKTIIGRRVAAYEQLEDLIISIKTAVLDGTDNKPYHLLFSQEDKFHAAFDKLNRNNSHALWYSQEIFDLTREVGDMVYYGSKSSGVIEFGKANYKKIAELREKLEQILASDLLELHDVRQFLKSKKELRSGFRSFHVTESDKNPQTEPEKLKPTERNRMRAGLNNAYSIATILTVVLVFHGLYVDTVPVIETEASYEDAPFAFPFTIRNNSPLFNMKLTNVSCIVHDIGTKTARMTGDGSLPTSIVQGSLVEKRGQVSLRCPIETSGVTGANIVRFEPDAKVEYASIFLKVEYNTELIDFGHEKAVSLPNIPVKQFFIWNTLGKPSHWTKGDIPELNKAH